MSITASASTMAQPLKHVQTLMHEAEKDIRKCFSDFTQSPLAQSDKACKEIGKRIAGIEASLASLTCDEDTRESFQLLTADLRCLTTRVSIAAKKDPAALTAEKWRSLSHRLVANDLRKCTYQLIGFGLSRPKQPKKFDVQRFTQRISGVKFTECPGSEKNGCKAYGVFVTSNETGQKKVRDLLKTMKKIPNGVHLGISGLHNWNLIAQMQSSFAILIDFNPNTAIFHRNMLSILAASESPDDFIMSAGVQMNKDREKDPDFYFPMNNLYMIAQSGDAHSCTLSNMYINMPPLQQNMFELILMKQKDRALSKENFLFLRKMAREGRIVPFHLDACDTAAIKTIADAVKEQGFVFSSLYLSNVFDYLKNDQRTAFKQNIDALKQDGTCVFSSAMHSAGAILPICYSFLHYGKDPETGNAYDPDIAFRWLRDRKNLELNSCYKQPAPLEAFGEFDLSSDHAYEPE